MCKSQGLSFLLLYIFSAQAVHKSSRDKSIVLLYIQRHIHFCAFNFVYFTPCVRSELTPPLIYSLTIYLAASKTEKLYNRDISFLFSVSESPLILDPPAMADDQVTGLDFQNISFCRQFWFFWGASPPPGSFSHCGSVWIDFSLWNWTPNVSYQQRKYLSVLP